MKILSIKRLVLSATLLLGSVMTLPAYAWPDTDEMNMCGSAVKNVRGYAGQFRGWAAHDIYVDARGLDYYFRTNCPESTATKNYKGKNWTPGAKMAPVKKMKPKKRKYNYHKSHKPKHHKRKHHKQTADCIRVDKMNNSAIFLRKANSRMHQQRYQPVRKQAVDHNFYRQAQAVLNMSKVKPVAKIHKAKHKKTADCIRTDGLNSSGAVIRVLRR